MLQWQVFISAVGGLLDFALKLALCNILMQSQYSVLHIYKANSRWQGVTGQF